MDLIYTYQQWPYAETFRISRGASVHSDLFVAWVRDGHFVGRGECGVLSQYGQTPDCLADAFEAAREVLHSNPSRAAIAANVPNSSVRNALDCALWDLECKRTGLSIWQLTGVTPSPSVEVDHTISVNPIEKMSADAARAAAQGYRILKLKADREDVIGRIQAVGRAAPGARFIVDANEAWDLATLASVCEPLSRLGVILIEQPLHHQRDDALAGFRGPIPICADESCRDVSDLYRLADRYQAINIKLDKVGGLTPGLELAHDARRRGLKLMLGCGGATSLGAAPAYVVATLADYVDLDSPALLLDDRAHAMTYGKGRLNIFDRRLWGG
ncbi:MAG TPA: dipeptide epimerase [Caulobacteraceae bacterium]|nr:dipeptide epimerase [Caulobacteraceae bacterium]